MSTSDDFKVSIPVSLGDFVASRVATGQFTDASQYVSALIDADRVAEAKAELRAFLLAGIHSGPGIPVDEQFWEEYRNRAIERARKAESA